MFILIALVFIICGVLLFYKSRKMPKEYGVNIIVGICAVGLIILGVILTLAILFGRIALP